MLLDNDLAIIGQSNFFHFKQNHRKRKAKNLRLQKKVVVSLCAILLVQFLIMHKNFFCGGRRKKSFFCILGHAKFLHPIFFFRNSKKKRGI